LTITDYYCIFTAKGSEKMYKITTIFMVLFMTALVFPAEITIQPDSSECKDSQITNYSPSANYGTRIYLTENWSDVPWITRGMIEFNLSKYFDPSKSFKVVAATMSFYHINNSPVSQTWYLNRITESWDEATVTFTNKPGYDTTSASSVVCKNSEGWEDFDVKDLLQKWLNKTYSNYGIYLWIGSAQSGITTFLSSDYSDSTKRPKLYVKYDDITSIVPSSFGDIKALYK